MEYIKTIEKNISGDYELNISLSSKVGTGISVLLYSDLDCNIIRGVLDIDGKANNRFYFETFEKLIEKYDVFKDEKDIEIYFAYLKERTKFKELVIDIDNHCGLNPNERN